MKALTRICMLKGMRNWSTYMQDTHAQPIFSTLFQVGSLLRCFLGLLFPLYMPFREHMK